MLVKGLSGGLIVVRPRHVLAAGDARETRSSANTVLYGTTDGYLFAAVRRGAFAVRQFRREGRDRGAVGRNGCEYNRRCCGHPWLASVPIFGAGNDRGQWAYLYDPAGEWPISSHGNRFVEPAGPVEHWGNRIAGLIATPCRGQKPGVRRESQGYLMRATGTVGRGQK